MYEIGAGQSKLWSCSSILGHQVAESKGLPCVTEAETQSQSMGQGAQVAWFSGCVRYNAPTIIHTK